MPERTKLTPDISEICEEIEVAFDGMIGVTASNKITCEPVLMISISPAAIFANRNEASSNIISMFLIITPFFYIYIY